MRPDQPAFAGPEVPLPLRAATAGLAQAAAGLSARIARNGIEADLASAVGTNAGGDGQKALDVIADDAFRDAAAATGVRFFASEEQDEVVTLDPAGTLALVIDPLDGSSNIDVDVSIGTIFGFYPAETTADASVLRPAAQMLAGGYVIYGPQCCLMVSYGAGVMKYVLDPGTGQFHLVQKDVQVPAGAVEYAVNASNYRHWPKPIRSYVDDLVAGAEGPRGKNFNMRWIASLVAETHRIITRGGVFLYPRDSRKGYENGRLRLLYEGGPIAFLMAHAGGAATDGEDALLTAVPARLHARTPLVFGSADKVARVAAYHDLPDEETSALFGKRGLFRS